MNRTVILFLACAVLVIGTAAVAAEATKPLTLHIVYDNYPCVDGLKTNWGFGCVLKGAEKTIVFDTGTRGELLLENFEKMGLDPRGPKVVILSHIHNDHTSGLAAFLEKNHEVTVYVPASFPEEFVEKVEATGAKVIPVTEAIEICKGVYLTGETGEAIKEQGLILDRGDDLVLITGCAHPGIVAMTRQAKGHFKRDVAVVLGGFHLNQLSSSEAKAVVAELKELGVREVGPSHCTGKEAIAAFEQSFGKNFFKLGVGRTLVISK
ncbi:MAG: MBL fold metallo-hydrolase [Thermoguttaceae bacterium]